MPLNLQRPLCIFDLETTGVNFMKDRIVEMHILKVSPDGQRDGKTYRLNPTIPIPKEATLIHGIANEDVAGCPTFADMADEILASFEDSDLAGFNSNRFDIPLLVEEFLRVGKDFRLDERKQIDVQNIFHKMEKRTLEAAYLFYCNKELKNAHNASADTEATFEVLESQLTRYKELINNVDYLSQFSVDNEFIDTGKRLKLENGKEIFNFGKYKGQTVAEVLKKDPSYYSWIQNNEFALHTKIKLKEIKEKLK
jgi:DNA polymerase-3 subunit epsilon